MELFPSHWVKPTENQKLPLQANDSSSGGKLKDELAHAEQVDVGVVDGEVHLFEDGSLGFHLYG